MDEVSVEAGFDSAAGFESAGLASEAFDSLEPEVDSPPGLSLDEEDAGFDA